MGHVTFTLQNKQFLLIKIRQPEPTGVFRGISHLNIWTKHLTFYIWNDLLTFCPHDLCLLRVPELDIEGLEGGVCIWRSHGTRARKLAR